MDYQVLVPDLDGTLTNWSKIVTPKTKIALIELQKQGEKVVLASGRSTYGVLPLTKELELEIYGGYVLSYNGDVIMDCRTSETVFSRYIPVKYNATIIRLAVDRGVNILTYGGDKIITLDGTCLYAAKGSAINKLEVEARADVESYVTFQVPKFLMLDDGDYLTLVKAQVKAKLDKPFSTYRSGPYFLEIMPRGIDKAQPLGRLLEGTGSSREQMIACNDGHNDLTAIQYASLGVAMKNIALPLGQAVGCVTLSSNDDGIAHVVERFMFS